MIKNSQIFIDHIRENVREIKKSIKNITFHTFTKNTDKKLAILRRLEIIGEATKNLSKKYRNEHPEIPWKKMAGLRDIIIHNYYELEEDVIWNVIQYKLPDIESDEYDAKD